MNKQSKTLFQFMPNIINQYFRQKVIYLNKSKKLEEIFQIIQGVEIFLKFFPKSFKTRFYSLLDLELRNQYRRMSKRIPPSLLLFFTSKVNAYISHLFECFPNYIKIFLSRDAYILYSSYREQISDPNSISIELLYNRKILLGGNNNSSYLTLTSLIYKQDILNVPLNSFITSFKDFLKKETNLHDSIRRKTHTILQRHPYLSKLKKTNKVLIIDSGAQGTLLLPLLIYFQENNINTDFSMFTCYPWIYSLYKNRVFSKECIPLLPLLEKKSIVKWKGDNID